MRIGFSELLLILVLVMLVFGTSKLRDAGSDLGAAVRNFRKAMRDGEAEQNAKADADKKPEPPKQ